MPVAVFNFLFAVRYGNQPEEVAGLVVVSTLMSFATLPLLLVRALGGYRSNDAAVIAALMLLLTIAAFVLIPRLFARFADARAR